MTFVIATKIGAGLIASILYQIIFCQKVKKSGKYFKYGVKFELMITIQKCK